MQKLWKVTCDFCGKRFDRQKDLPRRKKYTLHNISVSILDRDTSTQGASELDDLDFCNLCALKFINYIKSNMRQPYRLSRILTSFHEPDPNDNNSLYRYTSKDSIHSNKVYCTLEDYENEEPIV